LGAVAGATSSLFDSRFAQAAPQAPRELTLYHTHTDRRLSVAYFADGAYVQDALTALDRFLCDFRTGEVKPLDRGLFDILYRIQRTAQSAGTYEIIAAYRSPETNEMLRRLSSGVARNSLHLTGQAIDVRLTDLHTTTLRDIARSLKAGGVGYYASSDFVHVDTGRVRYW
jgi:uncharacterized protein YcbK (DUF882 family)